MRISDWSSDVCSSDLRRRIPAVEDRAPFGRQHRADALAASASPAGVDGAVLAALPPRRVSLTHLADRRRPPISALFRSEEHTSELQSLMRISYDVFCLKKKINTLIENIRVSTTKSAN